MPRISICLTALLTSFAFSGRAVAHGTPIQVGVADNTLVVSGGLADTKGFAPMIFVEDDEEGDPFGEVDLPGFGPSIVWQVPGYEISGMDEHSGLFLDVMSRPFAHASPIEHRTLWYWSPSTQKVSTTPANPLQIRKSASVNVTLSPADGTDPPPLQIAEPLSGDLGFHNHLVAYALSQSTTPPAGAYGFFARLTSNQYAASDPFLVVVNNGVFDHQQMIPAARAINAAAFLPGDYNHDERVDGADYAVWRKTFASTTELAADGSYNQQIDPADYGVWQRNYGAAIAGSAAVGTGGVPEPPPFLALIAGLCFYLAVSKPRRLRKAEFA